MEIPKNAYACANCHQRFNNPTILIKHVELRHSIAKKSQSPVWNSDPEEINASIENQDPLENADTCTVPLKNSDPISIDLETDPLEDSIKVKYEPEKINASIENRDPLENTSTRASQIIVVNPFEFCGPISNVWKWTLK